MFGGLSNGLFRRLRRWLAHHPGMRTKQGAGLALDILSENGITDLIVIRQDGSRVRIPTGDKVISTRIIIDGHFALPAMESLTAKLRGSGSRPEDLRFVNVGANIGTTCLNAIALGFRDIVAVEPDPANYAILEENLAPLRKDGASISTVNVAVGAEPGEATLHLNPINYGKHSLVAANAEGGSQGRTVRVPVRTLASLIDPGRPFVLFADVEGYEPQVLEGAADGLRDCRAMCLELTPRWYDAAGRAILMRELSRYADTFVHMETGKDLRPQELEALLAARGGQFNVIALGRA